MIDVGELLVQFFSQLLGLFLLEELRACSGGSGGSGLPMDSVRFHETPVRADAIGRDFFLIIALMSPLLGQQESKGGVRHHSIRMTETANNPC